MKIYFSHGKETGPNGRKIQVLREIAKRLGLETESVDYRESLDPDERADKLLRILEKEDQKILLVGSSMGSYVSLVASLSIKVEGLFLLAPALYLEGYDQQEFNKKQVNTEIFHGWSDDIVPVENSIRYASQVECSLNLLDGDHRLSSPEVLDVIKARFESYLSNILNEIPK
jgi:predicted esterase